MTNKKNGNDSSDLWVETVYVHPSQKVRDGWGTLLLWLGEESKDRSRSSLGMTTRKARTTTTAKAKAKSTADP
jgi:hypothetical protein